MLPPGAYLLFTFVRRVIVIDMLAISVTLVDSIKDAGTGRGGGAVGTAAPPKYAL